MKRLNFCATRLGVFLTLTAVAILAPHALAAVPFVLVPGVTTTAFNAGGASDINEALKIFFNDPVIYNVVSDSELLGLFQEDNNVKQDETTGGRYIETAQYFTLPAGVGARAEGEYIPVPDGPVIKNSRILLKKIQGTVEMTGDVMRRVKGDMGAYLNWMERALPDLVTRLNNELDRMTLGYGNGVKARINALPGGVIVRVDRSFGAAINSVNLSDSFLEFLEGERIVASANANGNPIRNAGAGQSARIVSVNPDVGLNVYQELTVDAIPGAWAQNDYLFAGDPSGVSTQDAGGADREVMGLLGMVDDGTVLSTFQNLVRATYKLWNSVAIDGSVAPYNGALNEDLIVFADDQTYVMGGGKIDAFVTSRSGARSLWKSLKGDRILNDPRSYTGGKGPIGIILGDRDVTLKVCRKMPPELAFGLQKDTFKRWTLGGFIWDDTPGAIWNRVTDATGRKDAFYAVGNLYLQLGCLAPRKNFRIGALSRA
jgi:hypothetical protein